MTEDEYYDLELDRNYEYTEEHLLHNFDTFGWLDPFANVEFGETEKKDLLNLKRRRRAREQEDIKVCNEPNPPYVSNEK